MTNPETGPVEEHDELNRIIALGGRVCVVRCGSARGTGFLIDGDHVLTASHVLPTGNTGSVTCSFHGDPHEYHAKLRCRSPHADWDVKRRGAQPAPLLPTTQELDFAYLQLEGPDRPKVEALRLASKPCGANERVYILHYPAHGKGGLHWSRGKVLQLPKNRVRYDASTNSGSSGAPCFDTQGNVVALHHAGDPDAHRGKRDGIPIGKFNQGVPIGPIRAAIAGALEGTQEPETPNEVPAQSCEIPSKHKWQARGSVPDPPPRPRWIAVVAGAVLLLVAVGIGIYYFLNRPITCVAKKTQRSELLNDVGDPDSDERYRVDELEWTCDRELQPGKYRVRLEKEIVFCGRGIYQPTEAGYRCEKAPGDPAEVPAEIEVQVQYGEELHTGSDWQTFTNTETVGSRHVSFDFTKASTIDVELVSPTRKLSLKTTCKSAGLERDCFIDFAPARKLSLIVLPR